MKTTCAAHTFRRPARFGDESIQDLPVQGRFYSHVSSLAPGEWDTNGDGNPNVHDSRKRDFRATVGGVINGDPAGREHVERA